MSFKKFVHLLKMYFSSEYRLSFQTQAALLVLTTSIQTYLEEGRKHDTSNDVRKMHLRIIEQKLVEYLSLCPEPTKEFWEKFIGHHGNYTLMAIATKYNKLLAPKCLQKTLEEAREHLRFCGSWDRADWASNSLAAAAYFNGMAGDSYSIKNEIAEGFKLLVWAHHAPRIFQMP